LGIGDKYQTAKKLLASIYKIRNAVNNFRSYRLEKRDRSVQSEFHRIIDFLNKKWEGVMNSLNECDATMIDAEILLDKNIVDEYEILKKHLEILNIKYREYLDYYKDKNAISINNNVVEIRKIVIASLDPKDDKFLETMENIIFNLKKRLEEYLNIIKE